MKPEIITELILKFLQENIFSINVILILSNSTLILSTKIKFKEKQTNKQITAVWSKASLCYIDIDDVLPVQPRLCFWSLDYSIT